MRLTGLREAHAAMPAAGGPRGIGSRWKRSHWDAESVARLVRDFLNVTFCSIHVETRSTTFETFPFPWPPRHEPAGDPRVEAIAAAARELVAKRDAWLNPEGASEAELKKAHAHQSLQPAPTWLDLAHRTLDHAVLDADGWPHDAADEDILARLLALNLARAGRHAAPTR
jgi:hypothetical protein